MTEMTDSQNQTLYFFRLESSTMVSRTIISSMIGILVYVLIYSIKFPQYTFFCLDLGITTFPIKGGIDLPIVVIILIAVFCGPLAGFTVGFFGSLGAVILFTNQLIVFGTINFSFGILGFIVGIPRYTQNQGFADGRKLAILLLYSFIGFFLMNFIYLVSLLVIANQSFVATLLYNFLPYFSIWVISLFLIAPVVVRITEIIIFQVMELWESRTGTT